MDELIARVEAAAGPDRDIDLAICIALNTGRSTDPRNPGAPHYSASLDAAMTLVPEGWGITLRRWADGTGRATAGIYPPCGASDPAHAATPALALVAAALRAREPSL